MQTMGLFIFNATILEFEKQSNIAAGWLQDARWAAPQNAGRESTNEKEPGW
jgi:hypothetical protein